MDSNFNDPVDATGSGDILEPVLPGLPIADYLPLWHADGRVSYWRMTEPQAILANLGRGAFARAEVDTRRYRDAFTFNARTNELFLMNRFRSQDGIGAVTVHLIPASEQDVAEATTEDTLSELYDWVGEIVVSAVDRGEFVAVETGGWDVPFRPYALVVVRPADGAWHVAIETSPTPTGAPVWRDQVPIDADGQTITAPATEETLHAAGSLVGWAASTWAVPVRRLGLSFGPNPVLTASG